MMKNRVLSYLILTAFVFSLALCVPAMGAYSDYVLFEYGFDNYTGGGSFGTYDSSNVTLNFNSQGNLIKGEADGNVYVSSKDQEVSSKGRLQPTFVTAISTGKYAISFDVGRGNREGGGSDLAQIRESTSSSGIKFVYFSAADGKIYDQDKETYVAYEKNKTYRIDLFIDFDNDKQATYVDGKLLKEIDYTSESITKLDMFISWSIESFDNLKIAKVTADSFEATVTLGTGKVDIDFTEPMADGALDDAVILNTVTGESIEPTDVVKNNTLSYSLAINEALTPGIEYVVKTEKPITNFCGTELSKPVTFSTADVGKYVKSVKLVDYKGNEYYAGEELPPEIKVIKVYYTGMEASDEPTVALTCESASLDGDGVYDAAKQLLTYTLDEYLIGEKSYKLSINDALLDKTDYEDVEFSTKAGSISINKLAFTKSGIAVEELSALSDSDVINLEIEIINTTGEAKDMILSYSAWENGFIRGFDFKDVSMTQGTTYKSDKITGITISKNSTLTLDTVKGFLWTALGSNNPLADEIVLD